MHGHTFSMNIYFKDKLEEKNNKNNNEIVVIQNLVHFSIFILCLNERAHIRHFQHCTNIRFVSPFFDHPFCSITIPFTIYVHIFFRNRHFKDETTTQHKNMNVLVVVVVAISSVKTQKKRRLQKIEHSFLEKSSPH
jgi:hypothetical protein